MRQSADSAVTTSESGDPPQMMPLLLVNDARDTLVPRIVHHERLSNFLGALKQD
jgi:hypothetical protein